MKLLLVCVLGIFGLAVHHTSAGALLDRHVRDTENTPPLNVQIFRACIATVGSDKTVQKVCLDEFLSSIEHKKECCEYEGKRQCGPSQYLTTDGCNICSCHNGMTFCTMRACIQACNNEYGCTDVWDPVCKHQMKYTNECRYREANCLSAEMENNLKPHPCPNFCKEGQPFLCFAIYAPVCGSDGNVYSNECNLMVARCIDGNPSLHVDKKCTSGMFPKPPPLNILS